MTHLWRVPFFLCITVVAICTVIEFFNATICQIAHLSANWCEDHYRRKQKARR